MAAEAGVDARRLLTIAAAAGKSAGTLMMEEIPVEGMWTGENPGEGQTTVAVRREIPSVKTVTAVVHRTAEKEMLPA